MKHRLSRRGNVPIDDCVLAPGEHGVAGKLGAMVGHDHSWLAASLDSCGQFAGHAPSRDRRLRNGAQAFLGEVVDDVEDAEAPAVGELALEEVQRHQRALGLARPESRHGPHSFAANPPLADGEPFLAIKTLDPVDA